MGITALFQRLGMKQTLIGVFTVLVVLIATVFAISSVTTLVSMSRQAELRELSNLYKAVLSEIESQGKLATALSQTFASSPPVQQAFQDQDRATLQQLTEPFYLLAARDYGVKQAQFHLPPATSFLRLHRTEKFGDDLSEFRSTVVDVNRRRNPVSGIEKGVAGFGIRGVVPVSYQGSHLGSVEFGLSLNEAFLEMIKSKYDIDISMHAIENGKVRLLANTDKEVIDLSTDQILAARSSPVVFDLDQGEQSFALFASVLTDYAGEVIGTVTLAMDRRDYEAQISAAKRNIAIISVLIVAVGVAIAYFLSVLITTPLNRAVDAMKDISKGEGDLTKRLPVVGNNEFSRLAEAFNDFAEKVRGSIFDVSGSTKVLDEAVQEVNQMMVSITDHTAKQREEIGSVATAITEMTTTIHEVSKSGSDAAKAADRVEQESGGSVELLDRASDQIQQLDARISQANDVISKVSDESTNIGSVLDVIRGIAEQTNLLALNAAIEAARAGEQGRGFAVVADEVRTLASRTQSSTEEIDTMISSLQNRVSEAVSTIKQSREQASSGVALTKETAEALQTVKQSAVEIRDLNYQIATAVEEQTYVSDEINRNTSKIDELATLSLDDVMKAQSGTKKVQELSYQLNKIVGSFKI
ncbi:methyl-accepting chemotaxis protein [Aestuariibacter halophilus]|uniref:Methyl-accepting chemotaxis protein n=1 Tax=Fluctibacter halophilus TaxID=226011 RepID=A0ABS8GBH8_9ALTE|nr:methyl-accepting chemotaxis protein [Aestuariibacter halophilus]MCC2617930.1 methyl-accepting chemotaxis protein [Aestuariibacter halophilus]